MFSGYFHNNGGHMKNIFKSLLIGFLIASQSAFAGFPPTTLKGSTDATGATNFSTTSPGQPITHVGVSGYLPTPLGPDKTYVTNGDFESNTTTGWTLCSATLSGGAPTGAITNTAASFNALSVTSSSPLAGKYSLSISSAAATTAGQGFCSNTFTVDAEDSTNSPHVQTVKASYSGTANMNFSGSSANTWAVYIYDVTNSAWIQPAGVYNFIGDGKVVATFQPNKTSSQYRLVFLNVNASTGAIAMTWDSISAGPQGVAYGPAMSDAVSVPITFTGTTTNPTKGTTTIDQMVSSRFGDKLKLSFTYQQTVAGTAGSGTYLISMPAGVTINTTLDPINTTPSFNKYAVGTGTFRAGSAEASYTCIFYVYDSTHLGVTYDVSGNSPTPWDSTNAPFTNAIINLSGNAEVHVSGWSSNTSMSSDSDGREVAFSAYKSGGAITANTAIPTWAVVNKDTHAAFNATTGVYTIPVAGDYHLDAVVNMTTSASWTMEILKNGTSVFNGFTIPSYIDTIASHLLTGLVVGDQISIAISGNGTVATSTTPYATSFSMHRISGTTIVNGGDSVYMQAFGNAVISTSAGAVAVFQVKDFDSHNAYSTSTGRYACPVAGTYQVSVAGIIDQAAATFGTVEVWKNGAFYRTLASMFNGNQVLSGVVFVQCNLGDLLDIRTGGPSAGTGFAYSNSTGGYIPTFSIRKL